LQSRPWWLTYPYTRRSNGMNVSGHILVAEDDPTEAYFFERAFKRAGLPVMLHFVRDGQEVIDYLQGEGQFTDRTAHPLPRLMLLDLKMPRLDGFEVLEWVRKQPGFNALQVVIFSSSGEPKDMNRAYGLGANWYLVKPHSIEELTALVGRFKKFWLEGGKDPGPKAT
jgi:CheY-like chemotaxis protein